MEAIATSKNNMTVVVDTEHSHAAIHLQDDPRLQAVVTRALSQVNLEGETLAFEKDLGDVVGYMDLVKTTPEDEIVYAKRPNRDIYTRFVKNKEQTETSYVTCVLERVDDTTYELWSAWVGRLLPTFPGDENETPESKSFWSEHALVWGTQTVQPGTETDICPW